METAVLVDEASGTRQESGFLGPPGARLFATWTFPARRAASGGVVVCSSIHPEFTKNYRREVLVARALAGRGLATLRFHYRGAGNSDGDTADLTLETMADDARRAVEWLAERTGGGPLGFLGTRLGALVAATAAAEVEGAPLALWEPVHQGDRYTREAFRARRMHRLRRREELGPSAEALLEELRTLGSVEVLGYELALGLHESLATVRLEQLTGDAPRPVLLVEFSLGKELRPDYAALASRWRERGWPVTASLFPHEDPWWFTDDTVDLSAAGVGPLVSRTADWLARTVVSGPTP